MDDAPQADATNAVLDPTSSDPRDLMRALLPTARTAYLKAWETMADVATPLATRRIARDKAKAIAADHEVVAAALRAREASLSGDDLLNARHLADELERHAAALERMSTVPPLGLVDSKDLRPEALGCGRRYRDPSRSSDAPAGTRGVADKPKSSPRDAGGRGGRGGPGGRQSDPMSDRGPKAPRDMLGSSKHDSTLADDMDEATRAKLEELRKALES